MSNHMRGFYHYSEAWYASGAPRREYVDEVMFGFYPDGGGTVGEMGVRWQMLGGKCVPQLQVYDDAWKVLATFKDVIDAMAKHDNENIQPKDFCALLLACGFRDMTDRNNPNPKLPKTCPTCNQTVTE